MSDANELAEFISAYLTTVCDSHSCSDCPFFIPASTGVERRCKVLYANSILKAKGLEPLW